MTDTSDILLKILQEERMQARQSEDQRATVTNLVIIIAGALQSFIVNKGFDNESLILAGVMCLLGFLGIISTSKLYERYRLHMVRVGEFERRLDMLNKDAQIKKTLKEANDQHSRHFSSYISKIRLNQIWTALHTFIVLLGIVNFVIILH